jgi:hypothetical protein
MVRHGGCARGDNEMGRRHGQVGGLGAEDLEGARGSGGRCARADAARPQAPWL